MIREIDETILTEEEIKEFQKDKDSFIQKREKELKDFIGEEWKPIDGYGELYWLSNYGRIKSSVKIVRNRVYPEKIMSYTKHKKYKQTLVKISKNGKQKTFIIENLLDEYFPTQETFIKKKIKEEEKKKRDVSPRKQKSARFHVINNLTKEEFYATRKEEVEERLGLPENIINRIIENQYRDVRGYKIYLTEKGALEYCGKRKPRKKQQH